MTKYVLVGFPESQDYMGKEGVYLKAKDLIPLFEYRHELKCKVLRLDVFERLIKEE